MNDTNSRFEKNTANKFGDVFKSTFKCPDNMGMCVDQAIPIWIFLGMTEEQYKLKYCPVMVEETDK